MPEDHRHHHHDHRHGSSTGLGLAFALGTALNLAFVGLEATYGVIGHSMALLADAGHNLGDVLGLAVSWGTSMLSRRQPKGRYTYGLRGSSILAALLNAIILLIAVGGIIAEAIQRLVAPEPIAGATVMAVAGIGIVVNGITALFFMRGRHGDLNVKSAFMHMAADALVSLGVVAAGGAILATGWLWLDPAVSIAIAVVIVIGTWQLLRQSLDLALDAVPPGIDQEKVRDHLAGTEGVAAVHDLHIWPMSTTETALTCHLVMPGGHPGDHMLARLAHELHDRFAIQHATIQVETSDTEHLCVLVPDHIV